MTDLQILLPEEAIDLELKDLRDDCAFGPDEAEGYDVVKAMLTGVDLPSINPDKVAQATGLNRDKVRKWFRNLRDSGVIEVHAGRGTGIWCVNWFEENGRMALIMDAMCAMGLIRRVDPDEGSDVPPT